MKTILLNSNTLWSIVQFREELIKELQQKYRVVCVAGYDDFATDSYTKIKELGVKLFQLKMHRKGINPFEDFLYCVKLLRLYRKICPDLIFHYTIKPNIYGSMIAKILKIPSVPIVSGLGSAFVKKTFVTKIVEMLYAIAIGNLERVLFLNAHDRDEFIKRHIITHSQALLWPGEGVNTAVYTPCPKESFMPTNEIVFLMVSRLLRDKGVYEYIQAIRLLPKGTHAQFLLAGVFDEDNPTAISQEEVAHWEKEGYITYLGKTDDIKEFFVQCDVVVLPSYREGLSRVLLEANSCEKFIITTDVPGCRELCIDGENGFLIKPYDAVSLAKAILKTMSLEQEDLRQRAHYGRLLVMQTYSSQIVNQYYTDLIEVIFKQD